ncbi:peroxisome biogenesis protein 16 [Iris pallida]|uniref:Peroxisomal membrane protein PEX16 n=1 Tax=Iris pallida TaxID=29817 RepID=A0AAX6EEB7_IRIPA|nr:peroxisome biogenesis protein 16 [Iris pallida]KAJ6836842.1 peroxisome biogenesis protein 16 [Iris pallida]
MEVYKLWVRKHREFVHSLESLANGITWLLPERFSNSEIGPEAVYAFLGILSTVNQHIIDTAPSRFRPPASEEPSPFPWSLCVSTLKDLETVVEVAAQHFYGEDGKWNFIAVTEAMKAMVRLALFRDSGYKMLLQGGEVANVEEKVHDVGGLHHALGGRSGRPGGPGPGNFHNYNGYVPQHLEGRAMSALNRFGESAKMASSTMWLNRFQQNIEPPAISMEKPTLSSIWSQKGLCGQLFVTGEVLCILRPLIYVLLIRKYGIRSWTPWLVSLAVDLTAMGVLSRAINPSRGGGEEKYFQLSTSEKDEVKRRKLIWALYIMRDPFFTKYTKHRLEKTEGYLSHVPFVGFLTGKLVELIVGAQTRYTYTSGS